jgi:CubicO group peptidase (beta-lactamase class C family)
MIAGKVAPGFEPVREAFAANFERPQAYRELGAALAVYRHGDCVVDLWAGYADRARTRPWTRDTLVNLWSTTKGIAALCVARLVERGALSYADRVSDHWPDFAAAGKAEITVAQLLSHQAGLPGFADPVSIEDLFDQPGSAARLAAQAPLWPPGTANGYHAVTWGVLTAELVRRVDGRTIGRFLAEALAGPAGADVYIGLPPALGDRVAELVPPDQPVDLAALDLNPAMVMALASPRLDPNRANEPDWRAAELPALNGHGSAQGIARLYAGALSGALFSTATLAAMTEIAADRVDLVLGFNPQWGMGVARNASGMFGPLPDVFGHSGWGGSFGCAHRESGIAIGYALNHMGPELVGDPRATALCAAVFECVDGEKRKRPQAQMPSER